MAELPAQPGNASGELSERNKKTVAALRHILVLMTQGAITSFDLADRTGLAQTTVYYRLRELIGLGLVKEYDAEQRGHLERARYLLTPLVATVPVDKLELLLVSVATKREVSAAPHTFVVTERVIERCKRLLAQMLNSPDEAVTIHNVADVLGVTTESARSLLLGLTDLGLLRVTGPPSRGARSYRFVLVPERVVLPLEGMLPKKGTTMVARSLQHSRKRPGCVYLVIREDGGEDAAEFEAELKEFCAQRGVHVELKD